VRHTSSGALIRRFLPYLAKYKKTLQFKVRLESSAVPQRTVYVSDEDLKNAIHTDVIVEEDDSV
jgi:hypothetical protein